MSEFGDKIDELLGCNQKLTVPDVLPLVREYYNKEGNGVGGSLHIVLDDGNTENRHVAFCINYARECGDEDGVKLGELLLKMSRTQRHKIYMTH